MVRRILIAGSVLLASSAAAEEWSLASASSEFQRVDDRAVFVDLMEQGTLRRFGIKLKVEPDGRIEGRAFGRKVTGVWDWREGYFCRDMAWGSTEIEANCQEVRVSGDLVRFTSDQGQGRFADLRLDRALRGSKIDREPLLFPVAVAHGLRTVTAPEFGWKRVLLGRLAPGLRLGQGPLSGGRQVFLVWGLGHRGHSLSRG